MDLLKKMRIKDVMTAPVLTIFEEEPLSQAIEKFVVHGKSYLCVIDNNGRLAGLMSQKYLYKTKYGKARNHTP